ncbi:hypothetical protein FNV43_RR25229 [Rhamnella rubrinervis]|uniref:Receptor-like serine/threonine-protein kinase n=1 Tax=Rhamnella rubrinervis TaxID=2594499 RepID=A0A8K0GQZ0_9ROSA|nr:hypothetical protein FNV43_RR25229 [Rhamnella rubrinervis]
MQPLTQWQLEFFNLAMALAILHHPLDDHHDHGHDEELFLLAIWFDKIPDKTIVWYANGDKLAPEGSKVELTSSGSFMLNDPKGNVIWEAKTTNIVNGKVDYAEMLNNGNFVLANKAANDTYAWGTFKHPTDTMLPTQVLSNGGHLTSRQMQSNYLKGSQSLGYGDLGNLYIMGNNGSIVSNVTGISSFRYPKTEFYYRATLDFDGYFRKYAYPKTQRNGSSSATTQSWIRIWFIPQDICTSSIGQLGGGSCGFNTYCASKNGWPTCECLPGFIQSENGCVQEKMHTCELGGLNIEVFDNMFWPASANFDVVQPSNEENCSRSCLNDCNCVVAIIREGKCSKKKLPLSNGRLNISGSVFLNILFIMVTSFFFFFSYQKKKKITSTTETINLQSFTYDELRNATNGFKEELGRGAFGIVYKGVLSTSGSRNVIAVKKLDKVMRQGEKEFKAEVRALGKTHHKNLVTLIGFCDQGPNKLLIYEFMSNGPLANCLFRRRPMTRPDWHERIQIATGIARGLLYLHEECDTQIVHCDIKPHNILLDDSCTPRISDFGLAKLLMCGQSRTLTSIKGTKGYVAPEWFRNTPITAKVDVFSFGVVLMEIICCRKCLEHKRDENDEEVIAVLADWVCDCYKEGRLELIVGNDEEARSDMRKLETLVMVAIWCIQEDPSLRPSMRIINQMIEGVLPVPVPPPPYTSTSIC